MNIKAIARVTSEGKLEIPLEILQQLQPLTYYEIFITEKGSQPPKTPKKLTLNELFKRIDEIDPYPEQPTLEEISEIVKEVRQELWG